MICIPVGGIGGVWRHPVSVCSILGVVISCTLHNIGTQLQLMPGPGCMHLPNGAGCRKYYSWSRDFICTPSFPGYDPCPDYMHFSGGSPFPWGMFACMVMLLHIDQRIMTFNHLCMLTPLSWSPGDQLGWLAAVSQLVERAVNHTDRASMPVGIEYQGL